MTQEVDRSKGRLDSLRTRLGRRMSMIQKADRLNDKFVLVLAMILYACSRRFLRFSERKKRGGKVLPSGKASLETFLLSDITVRIENCKYLFTKRDKLLFAASETKIRHLVGEFLNSGGTFIDIGCNVGIQYAIPFACRLGNSGLVVAIDASPENIISLKKNIKLNGISNIIPLNLAISDHDGYSTFYLTGESWSGSLLKPLSQSYPIKVQSSTLDSLVTSLNVGPEITLVKIDVEGGEVSCIRGAAQTIRRTKHILIECHSAENKKAIEGILDDRFIIKGLDDLEDSESTHILCTRK